LLLCNDAQSLTPEVTEVFGQSGAEDIRTGFRMSEKVYISVGNHRSLAGIKEIVYALQSALSKHFLVELSRELKGDCVNIVIDEFSGLFDVSAMRKTTEL
jgi:hypothetical protein